MVVASQKDGGVSEILDMQAKIEALSEENRRLTEEATRLVERYMQGNLVSFALVSRVCVRLIVFGRRTWRNLWFGMSSKSQSRSLRRIWCRKTTRSRL